MDPPDQIAVTIEQDIDDGEEAQNHGKAQEHNARDHAWNEGVPGRIAEVPTDEEERKWDADEPDQRDKAELIEVGCDNVELFPVERFCCGVQALVGEQVRQMSQAPCQSDVEKEDEASDAHHDMEHVFIGLSEKHGHVMLFHFLWNDNSDVDQADDHQEQKVALTDQHKVTVEVVTDIEQLVRVLVQIIAIILAQFSDLCRYEVVLFITRVLCPLRRILVEEVADLKDCDLLKIDLFDDLLTSACQEVRVRLQVHDQHAVNHNRGDHDATHEYN